VLRRLRMALARFLPRDAAKGDKGKNALACCERFLPAPAGRSRLSTWFPKAFFPFSPRMRSHGAQKRAKAMRGLGQAIAPIMIPSAG